MPKTKLGIVLVALALTGCYHQVVRTGRAPGNVVIARPWTSTYIFGLVPAAVINTAAECPNGVAIVETQQTFVNGLVGALTFGIYTPQTVTITCAAAGAMGELRQIHLAADATLSDRSAALDRAIDLAERTGERVALVME